MKTVENFYLPPKQVLQSAIDQQPAGVVVVTMDDHGGLAVFSSHSTPVTMSMLANAPGHIESLREPS